ncbi:tRNA (adenosine(37)-N6)-threonylcarbamoyltransferase complex dimerization subunit type 1 TsaB [Streptococcus ovuberis]|uniref:tRNA (Adenosine(37)-N6)-threonylcarbamoyltransferase complex dimerization subunit type 1 TsaB n=1 Tax=Streptococcus ovuberis TaxID=1936207 RepID=A0A7X6N1N2_9STRE|nr:tRNA (adenosine(37)-N6)-threonylcarbamoyltransferase complex dimerization subunit type 1 TsaB [Streptococcus ovuberis]NKZ20572.1 tRNA (adenosine(37)-N6)-threonylcarbamoyltransferase complex dimerization subunit type 1 TsaB [Streptococcus ovuberis]
MKILAFDTSNQVLSIAILEDDRLLGELTLTIKKNHSISLMPSIDFLMDQVGWVPSDLERIAVAQGPGSYTGLRVAVATAKTLAYTLNIDLVGISSLYALCPDVQGLAVPLIDARRNTVYAGFYDNGRAVQPEVNADFNEVLSTLSSSATVTFVGEVTSFRDQIEIALPQAQILETLPSAYRIGVAALTAEPVPVHSFVPTYLKKVEAEENWLKDNQEGDTSSYIKRV